MCLFRNVMEVLDTNVNIPPTPPDHHTTTYTTCASSVTWWKRSTRTLTSPAPPWPSYDNIYDMCLFRNVMEALDTNVNIPPTPPDHHTTTYTTCASSVTWWKRSTRTLTSPPTLFLFRPNTYIGTCMSIEHIYMRLQGSRKRYIE